MGNRHPLDALVDEVARGLTARRAPSLREQVEARLGRQARPARRLALPIAAGLAGAAVVVALHWPRDEAVAPASSVARAVVTAPRSAGAVDIPPRIGRPVSVRPEPDPPVDQAAAVPALPPIAGLPVTLIQPDSLNVPQLTVAPFAPLPLLVPALTDVDRDR